MTKYRLLFLFFLVGTSMTAFSQDPPRLTEEDVNIQKVFIEASREKILGNYENAAFLYKEVLKRDNQNHAAAYELSRIYDTLNKDEKALASIKTAVLLDEKNYWYKSFLADLYKKTGQDVLGAEVYAKLVEQDPNNDYYYFRWAYFLVRGNEVAKAVKVYDALEKRKGISEEVVRRKHTLYVGSGNNKKAAKELQRLIEAYPKNTDYYHLLAGFYEQIGDQTAANEIYKKILTIDANDVKANIAAAAYNKGDNDMTYLHSLKQVFAQTDVNIDVKIKELFPYVNKVADSGNKDLATAALELSTILEEIHPDEAKAFAVSGDLLYYSDRKKEALEKYKKTIELDDNVYLVWEQMMYIYSEEEDYKKLETVAEEVMDIFPNQVTAYYFNGLALAKQQEYRPAISILDQALLMSGSNKLLQFNVLSLLGEVYAATTNPTKSDAAYEDALKLNPQAAEVLDAYSRNLVERGEKLERARTLSQQANELKPRSAAYQHTQALILMKLKSYESAKEWLDKAMGEGGMDNPAILESYGDVLFKTENTEEALEYWKKALEKGSTSDMLEKKIADKKMYE
ncbi:MAG: tetratricopeptide repeat protein [Saprospiraceae bacterium]